MAVNIDLEKYSKSPEFEEILSKAKNKIENIEITIETVYKEGNQDNELTRNEFDVKDQWLNDVNWILEQIKSDKAESLIEYYEAKIKNAKLFLFQPINKFGQSNSILRYTELDMLRFERSALYGIEHDIQGLIGVEDTEPKTEGAF